MDSFSPDFLYKALLLLFAFLSVASIFLFWNASPRVKMFMVGLTIVELCVVIFISLSLFKEKILESDSPSYVSNTEMQKSEDQGEILPDKGENPGKRLKLQRKFLKLFDRIKINGETRELFLTAEMFKGENQYKDALHYYMRSLENTKHLKKDEWNAILLFKIANMKRLLDESKEALTLFQDSLEIFQKQKNDEGIARVLNRVGRAEYQLSNFELAQNAYEHSLEIYKRLDKKSGVATSLLGLGNIAFVKGNIEASFEFFEKARLLFLETGKRKGYAYSLLKEGDVYTLLGKYGKAETKINEALKSFQDIENIVGEGRTLIALGKLNSEWGKHESSRFFLDKALLIFEKINDRRMQGICCIRLADAALKRNQPAIALNYTERAFSLFSKIHDQRHICKSLIIKSQVLMFKGKQEEALTIVNSVLKKLKEIGVILTYAKALYIKGKCLEEMGRNEEAKDCLVQSYKTFTENNITKWTGITSFGLGSVYSRLNNPSQVPYYFEQALKTFRDFNDTYWEEKVVARFSQFEAELYDFSKALALIENLRSKTDNASDVLSQAEMLITEGTAEYHMGNYEQSSMALRNALRIFESIDYKKGITQVLTKQIQLQITLGNYDNAETLLEKGFSLVKDSKEFYLEATILCQQAFLNQRKGKLTKAISEYKSLLNRLKYTPNFIIHSKVLRDLAMTYVLMGDFTKAKETIKQTKDMFHEDQNSILYAKYLTIEGLIQLKQGSFTQAESCFEKAFQIFKKAHLKRWQGMTHHFIGFSNYWLGDYEKAEYHLEKAMSIFKELDAKPDMERTLSSIGLLHLRKGKLNRATASFNEALMLTQHTKDLIDESYINMAFADLKRYTETPEEAKIFFEKVHAKATELTDTIGVGYGLSGLGHLESLCGDKDKGKKLLLQAYAIFEKAGYVIGISKVKTYLGDICFLERDFDCAKKYFEFVLDLHKKYNMIQSGGDIFRKLGHIEYKQGRLEIALRYYSDALRIARQEDNRRSEMRVLRYIAKVHAKLFNEYTYPREILTRSLRHFKENNDIIFEIKTLIGLGNLESYFNNKNEALSFYKEALQFSQRSKNDKLYEKTLKKLGKFYLKFGNYHDAQEKLEDYGLRAKKCLNSRGEGKALKYLGFVFKHKKEFEKARAYLRNAISHFKNIGDIKQIKRCQEAIEEIVENAV